MNSENKNITYMKLLRFASYVLFFTIVLYFISGYAMEKGFFNYEMSSFLHKKLLPVFAVFAFIVHSGFAIRFSMIRKKLWNKFTAFFLFVFYLLVGVSFVYFQYFYKAYGFRKDSMQVSNKTSSQSNIVVNSEAPPSQIPAQVKDTSADQNSVQDQTQTQTQTQNESQTSTTIKTNSSGQRIFTLDELKKYNGKNGSPAYAAVDGIVYDVGSVFKNGMHQGFSAGQDLSSAFHSQHSMSKLNGLEIVGVLE